MSRRLGALAAGLLWCGSRGLVVVLLFGPHAWVQGDLGYFRQSLDGLAASGWGVTLMEYPVPGVAVLFLPWLVTEAAGHGEWYAHAFVAMMLALDAAYLLALHRFARSWRGWPVAVWLVGPPLLGATSYARFDLVPGVLLGLAVLLLAGRPQWAALAAALATAVKFWPAVVLPTLAAGRRHRRPVVQVVLTTGGVLAVLSLVVAGWGRLLSPFTWQGDRGLQIESVLATPAMLAWSRDPDSFRVFLSRHNAYEITGPGVPVLLTVTAFCLAAYAATLAVLWWRAWGLGERLGSGAVAWLCLTAVSGFVVAGKVFSPQYVVWLLPIAAAALVVERGSRRRLLVAWTLGLLLVTALTHVVFPLAYGSLLSGTTAAVLVLALRNVLAVGLFVVAWRESWRQTDGSGVVMPASASAATISSRLMPRR